MAVTSGCVALLAWFGLALTACSDEQRRPPVAPRVNLSRPAALLPADVDLVLRLDVRRFREVIGPDWAQTLVNLWQGFLLDASAGAPERAWIAPALRDTDALWLGCRLGALGCQDYVVILRGQFSPGLEKYRFGVNGNERDLGGGWVSYDSAGHDRVAIARVYSRAPELTVLVSPAELDSAERSIEAGLDATELVPRETGLVSVVARSHGLATALRARSRKGAAWLDSSERLEIGVEPQAQGTSLTFIVTFSDAVRAERAAQALKLLTKALTQFERRLHESDMDVQQLKAEVVLRVRLGPSR